MDKKDLKHLKKAQQYAVDTQESYQALAEYFKDDPAWSEPLQKIADQKQKQARILASISGLKLTPDEKEKKFVLRAMKFARRKWLLKTMAASENEQGDILRHLAVHYPQLKSVSQEVYLQSASIMRLRDRYIKEKRSKRRHLFQKKK